MIGVLGNDDVYNTLKNWYDGKSKGTQKIAVKKLTSAADASACALVYLSRNKSRDFEDLKTAISGKHVLTITDATTWALRQLCELQRSRRQAQV
ncbi:MAG: YfiR family protein [Bacteroidota bacterium]